ncbi:MAG TPA: M23 family metallopeptidase [Candidatus Cloacimonadota bacterium]|nr:M23 family metallopeptidase [Candidatus Cloacimonadota bacterium]
MNKFKYIFLLLLILVLSCTQRKEEQEVVEVDPFLYKHGALQKGETLANALLAQNIDNTTVYKLVNQLNTVYNLRHSHPADSFLVKYDTLNVIHELRYMPDKIYTYCVVKDTADQYFTCIDTLHTEIKIQVCAGTIESSLWQAVIDTGANPALAAQFTQIFQWDIDFFIDPQKGDKFKMTYEISVDDNGDYVRTGDILAAQYATKGYDKIAYFYTNEKGSTKYYDETGKSFQKAFLKSPLNYKRITSYFGKRIHPVTKKASVHNGVDYAAAYGTPVEATADGTVIFAGWNPNHTGNTVKIRHANGYVTLYGHLSKFGKYKVGNRVQQHDIIGYVGSTGRSTGNHLHYTIYCHDKAIDPLKLKNVSGPSIQEKEMDAFLRTVDRLKCYMIEGYKTIYPDSTMVMDA